MRTIKWLLVILLVVAMALPSVASAKDTDKAGKITAVTGKAEVKKSGGTKKFNAFKGMAITQGDTIITGANGKVSMDLDSDKEVAIGPGATLTVSQLVKSAKALEGKTSLKLHNGQVMITVKKKLQGDSRFEIETPTAIMGVMGTQFFVGVNAETGETYIAVVSGIVKVTPENGDQDQQILPNEQLYLNKAGVGEKEPLDLNNLPLFALERYSEEIQGIKDDKDDLKNALKRLIEEKQRQAAIDAANKSESAPRPTIVYNDATTGNGAGGGNASGGSTGGSGGSTPSPAPSPTPDPPGPVDPTPDPIPDPIPDPVVGIPELELMDFSDNKYSYIKSAKSFSLPFSTNIAFNDAIGAPDKQGVIVTVLGGSSSSNPVVDITTHGRMLTITLESNIEIGSVVMIEIEAETLMNADYGDIQTDDVGPFEWMFEPAFSPDPITYIMGPSGIEGPREITVNTLGYELGEIELLAEGSGSVPFIWSGDVGPSDVYDYEINPVNTTTLVFKLSDYFLDRLALGSYYLIIPLLVDGGSEVGEIRIHFTRE